MIADVNKVIDWLNLTECKYWRVKIKDGDNATVFESNDDFPFETNVSNFRKVMDLSTGSRYIILAGVKKGVQKGNFAEEFRNMEHTPGQAAIGATQQVAMAGLSEADVNKRVQDAIDRTLQNIKVSELEKRNKELEALVKENDNATTRIMKKVEPYIGTIAGALVGKFLPGSAQVGIAGIDENNQGTNELESEEISPEQAEQIERLETALAKWAKADPDYISLLETIANMAATADPMYNMAKGMLKK